MRWIVLAILFFGLTAPVQAQVDADSSSDDSNSAPAAVGAPGRYHLNNAPANSVEVGRPYPYYYYPYYGSGAYPGAYHPGVQAVPDANDPNYFPMDAVMNSPSQPGTVKKKAAPKPNPDNVQYQNY